MMTNEKPVAAMMTAEEPAPDAGLRRVTTVEWFASLACLITWHVWYIRKENLDA